MRRKSFSPARGASAAFTLMELLVAMAVLALITVLLAVIVERASVVWSRAAQRVETQREAQVALETLAADISQAVRHLPNTNWLFIRKATDSEIGSSSPSPVPGLTSDWLMILSRSSDESGSESGATHAVVYRVAYTDPIKSTGTKPFYGLFRNVLSARQTLQDLHDGKSLDGYATSSSFSPGIASLLAKNVLAIAVAVEVAGEDGAVSIHACNAGDPPIRASDRGVFQGSVRLGTTVTAFQVALTVIPKSTADRLKESSFGPTAEGLLKKTSLSCSKYIPLQQR